MQNLNKIATGLAVGIFFVATAGNAHAQQWLNTTQQTTAATKSVPEQKTEKDWNYVIGGGIGYVPVYEGSDEYDFIAVPVVSVDYKDGLFFANVQNGIGSYPLRGENWRVGASIGYAPGRDADEDRKNLTGMGDLDASATANLLAEYNIIRPVKAVAKVTTGLSGDYGTTVDLGLGSRYPISEKVLLSGSVGTTWADEEHMENRFGVSAGQSAASGYGQYTAESGFKTVGFSVGATYLLTDKWSTNLTFRGDKLIGDAADSPLVKDDFVPSMFLATSYKF